MHKVADRVIKICSPPPINSVLFFTTKEANVQEFS